ncbi:deoxynucleoside kinase [Clostridium bornimense]|uniref:deoxynucleoside kinase n=1 Tax=Clostridium bornimense TaxID=1216932 RepID=UPI00209DD11B|nr:deoxynucleoside kinase [Clostridium bornimense]
MKYREYLKKIEGKESWPMIVVDGVVGVGKTTLMNILVKEFGYTAFLEPVVDNPILDKFYYDRKRYSFPLQIFFLNNRFRYIKEASLIDKAVLDRSIYGDLIFAKLLVENDEMDEEEYNIYLDLFENMVEHLSPPKLMIYLETSVDDAIKKINKRGRDYEQVVEKDYWLRLNKQYTEYFKDYSISPLLKINVDSLDFENNPKDREYVLGLIKDALDKIEK